MARVSPKFSGVIIKLEMALSLFPDLLEILSFSWQFIYAFSDREFIFYAFECSCICVLNCILKSKKIHDKKVFRYYRRRAVKSLIFIYSRYFDSMKLVISSIYRYHKILKIIKTREDLFCKIGMKIFPIYDNVPKLSCNLDMFYTE